MAARDLAIGILLGGGGSRNTCQYLADNSKQIEELIIDSRYKITVNALDINNIPEFDWLPGTQQQIEGKRWEYLGTSQAYFYSRVDNGVAKYFMRGYNVHDTALMLMVIYYEDDIPFMIRQHSTYNGSTVTQFERDGKYYYMLDYTIKFDVNNYTKNYTALTLYNPSMNCWKGRLYAANDLSNNYLRITFSATRDRYHLVTDSQGQYPEFDYSEQENYRMDLPNPISLIDYIADVPISETNEKRLNLISAVNKRFYGINTTEEMELYVPENPYA